MGKWISLNAWRLVVPRSIISLISYIYIIKIFLRQKANRANASLISHRNRKIHGMVIYGGQSRHKVCGCGSVSYLVGIGEVYLISEWLGDDQRTNVVKTHV